MGGGGGGGGLGGGIVGGALGGTTGAMLGTVGLDKVGGAIFGTGENAGILGTGQYKASGQAIDEKAFKDNEELKKRQAEFQRQMQEVQNRKAQQVAAAQINTGPQDQFRNAQLGLVSQLQQQAAGQGPSIANMQLQQGADRNLKNAIAMQASQRGGMAGGLAMRNIAQQRADIGQQLAGQAGMQRLQEQQQAQQMLGGVSGGARGQDIGLATEQAQLGQQAALANQNANLQQMALNDKMSSFYNTGLADLDMAQRGSAQDLEKLKVNQNLGVQGINAQSYEGASKRRGDLIGGIGGGLATAFSDKRLKMNIKDDDKELDHFLSGLNGHAKGGVIGKYETDDSGGEDETEKKAKELMSGEGTQNDSGQTKTGKAIGFGIGSAFKDDKKSGTGTTVAAGTDTKADFIPMANKGGVAGCMADGGMVKEEKRADKVSDSMKYAFKTPEDKPKEPEQDESRPDPLGFRKKFGLPTMNEGGMTEKLGMLAKLAPMAMAAMSDKGSKEHMKPQSYEHGGTVAGRAKVAGDSPKNDTVLAKLSPGEGVIKRTDMQDLGIKNGDQLQEFVDGLKAYTYNYKNPEHGEGKYASPMAQDLEKSELGKSMVIDTPQGKMVDYSRAAGTMLATAAMLNDKMKKLESKVGGYADGGMVEDDPLAKSMRLAFNALERKPAEPNSRPDYHVTNTGTMHDASDAEKKFAEAMRKAFRGK